MSRIRVAKDKAELIQSLVEGAGYTAPFQTFADVLAFCASLGSRFDRKIPLKEITQNPSPIALEIFVSRGYDSLINLIAIAVTKNPSILSPYDNSAQEERIKIFEEYANGGLEILQDELKGAVDYTERLLLIISGERFSQNKQTQEFDLSHFL
jgi:dnd system-associated protein 4